MPIASLAPDVANGNAPPVAEDDVNDILTVALRDKILATVTETVRLWLQLAHFDGVTISSRQRHWRPRVSARPAFARRSQAASAYHSTQGLGREVMDMAIRGISDNFYL